MLLLKRDVKTESFKYRKDKEKPMSLTEKLRSSKKLRNALAGIVLSGAIYSLPIQNAQAEPQKAALAQYKTVDDILGDLFEPISTEGYDEAVKSSENVVVLFYNSEGMNTPTEYIARAFSSIADKYDGNIRFFKFEDDSDPQLLYNNHQGLLDKFEIEGIPSYQLFKHGKKVFSNKGGPETIEKIAEYAKGAD